MRHSVGLNQVVLPDASPGGQNRSLSWRGTGLLHGLDPSAADNNQQDKKNQDDANACKSTAVTRTATCSAYDSAHVSFLLSVHLMKDFVSLVLT